MKYRFIIDNNAVIAAIPHDNSITATAEDVIICNENEIESVALALGLDANNMNIDIPEDKKKLLKYQQFGRNLRDRFLLEDNKIEISLEVNLSRLEFFGKLEPLLLNGTLPMAFSLLQSADTELFIATPDYATDEARKQSYITELENFLANN